MNDDEYCYKCIIDIGRSSEHCIMHCYCSDWIAKRICAKSFPQKSKKGYVCARLGSCCLNVFTISFFLSLVLCVLFAGLTIFYFAGWGLGTTFPNQSGPVSTWLMNPLGGMICIAIGIVVLVVAIAFVLSIIILCISMICFFCNGFISGLKRDYTLYFTEIV